MQTSKRSVLVCGGAGYVGAHTCEQLAQGGIDIVVFDNLSAGRKADVRWGSLVVGDLRDARALHAVFASNRFDAVMHFAGRIVAGESVRDPAAYYANNVAGMLNLLDTVRLHRCPPVVFASSAAVYGAPPHSPVEEAEPCAPANPYGRTKLAAEQMLHDFHTAYGLRSVSLRYFNVAGASPSGLIGEMHEPETHLIPNAFTAARHGTALSVFGDDYATPDGTCVRDYVSVVDVSRANLSALDHLWADGESAVLNVGSGRAHSVLDVIVAAERVTGRPIERRMHAPRPGDSPVLVADVRRAQRILGWQPVESDLTRILESAWRWELARAGAGN